MMPLLPPQSADRIRASTVRPTKPVDGDIYFDTTDHELYFYDSVRGKWLSVSMEFFDSGYSGTPSTGTTLKSSFGTVQGNGSRGWIPPHAITIVGMKGTTNNTFTGNMTVRENTTNTVAAILFSSSKESTNMTLDYDFDITKHMLVKINITSGAPTNPTCRVYYRRLKA